MNFFSKAKNLVASIFKKKRGVEVKPQVIHVPYVAEKESTRGGVAEREL